MTTETNELSSFYVQFKAGIDEISNADTDEFHYALYLSHAISLMEKYLQDVFIHEISNDRSKLVKLATLPKFNTQTLKLPFETSA